MLNPLGSYKKEDASECKWELLENCNGRQNIIQYKNNQSLCNTKYKCWLI